MKKDYREGGIAENAILIGLMLSPLFIINWLHNTRFSTRFEYLLLFQTLTIVTVALSHKNRWLCLFGLWSVVNYYLLGFRVYSSPGFFMVFMALAWMLILYRHLTRPALVLKAIAISALIVISTQIAQIIGVLPLTIGEFTIGIPLRADNLNLAYNGVAGFLAQPNITGAYLAICLPIFFIYFRSCLWLVIIAVIITKCNGAIIAGSVGAVFYHSFRPQRKIRDIIIICLIGILFSVGFCFIDRPDYSTRLHTAKYVLNHMTNWRILTGDGFGSFAIMGLLGAPTGNPLTDWMKQAHNEYIHAYKEIGLIGLGLILFFLGSLLNAFIKQFKQRTELSVAIFSSIIIIVLLAGVSFTFHHPLTFLISSTLLVLCDKYLGDKYYGERLRCNTSGVSGIMAE